MVARSYIAAGALAALALAACSGSPPSLDGTVGATLPPPSPTVANAKQAPSAVGTDASSPGAAKPNDVAIGPQTITGFKKSSVILYTSPTSADGQRVPTATMPLPLSARGDAVATKRLEVMTLDGLRWIARSDVVLAEASQR